MHPAKTLGFSPAEPSNTPTHIGSWVKPAVEHLKRFCKKVYHATFAKIAKGTDLRKSCFGAIDLETLKDEIKRQAAFRLVSAAVPFIG